MSLFLQVYAKARTTRRPLRASFNRLEGCGSRNRRLPLDRSSLSNVYQLVVLFLFTFVYRVPVEVSRYELPRLAQHTVTS